MDNQLPGGVPKGQNYRQLIESTRFKEMEKFSNNFLSSNKKHLETYARKWVADPLHQWSRQWEYSFVFDKVGAVIKNRESVRILDAGSGITFFPYFIKQSYPSTNIDCVDNDPNLEDIYKQINTHGNITINFARSDLRKMFFDREQFDIVYCISVLEHTDVYSEIIDGFRKILRPEGRLIITFDISLDGTRDISVEKAAKLLGSLATKFDVVEDIPLELSSELSAPDVFTTHTVREIDLNLLPWKLPQFVYRVNSFIRGHRFGIWPPLLTVFCLSLQKKPS